MLWPNRESNYLRMGACLLKKKCIAGMQAVLLPHTSCRSEILRQKQRLKLQVVFLNRSVTLKNCMSILNKHLKKKCTKKEIQDGFASRRATR